MTTERTDKAYFQFYQTFFEAIERLPEERQLGFYKKLVKYGLFGEADDIEISSDDETAFFILKEMIDNQRRRRKANQENGRKGGAPSGNKNAKRDDPECPTL